MFIEKCQGSERKNLKTEMGELRKELYKRENKAIKEVLQSAECILATLTTCHDDGPLKHLQDDHFDIIIVIESLYYLNLSKNLFLHILLQI